MKKIIFLMMLCTAIESFLFTAFSAENIAAEELINKAKLFDGKVVSYQGEAIGDIMQRKGGQWVNVLDNGTAIGVWTETDVKKQITFLGNYKAKGDTVQVKGTLNRFCKQHGGDFDVHANEFKVISKGKPVKHQINIKRLQSAILLTLGAILAFGFNLSRAKRYL